MKTFFSICVGVLLAFGARGAITTGPIPTLAGNNTFTGMNTFNGNSHMVGNITFDGFNTFNHADIFNGGETFNAANTFAAANAFNSGFSVNNIQDAGSVIFNMSGGNGAVVFNTVDGSSCQFQFQDQGNNQWSYGINPGFFGNDILNLAFDQMNGNLVVSVAPSTDYVGIMTSSPKYTLDVNGTIGDSKNSHKQVIGLDDGNGVMGINASTSINFSNSISAATNLAIVAVNTNDFVPGRWVLGPAYRFCVRAAVSLTSSATVPFQGELMYSNAVTGTIMPVDMLPYPASATTITLTNILKLYDGSPNSMFCVTNTGTQNASVPKINGCAILPQL